MARKKLYYPHLAWYDAIVVSMTAFHLSEVHYRIERKGRYLHIRNVAIS